MTRHTTTTSVRLPAALQAQLARAVRSLHKRKSWIIIHALEMYLETLQTKSFAKEARRQSLLAAKLDDPEETQFWEDNSDTTGWE